MCSCHCARPTYTRDHVIVRYVDDSTCGIAKNKIDKTTGNFVKYTLTHKSSSQPLRLNANPAANDDRKSAIKKSTIHLHIDRTVGDFLFLNTSLV